MVGAVLVSKNKILARGFHHGFGLPHAERDLLQSFSGAVPADAILYVNLEPCCHRGKTPPCTDIILERGVKRVCFGMLDPDPRVAGQGIAALRRAGVEVIGPVVRASCVYFNRGFVSMRTKGRPWIILKKAQTVDGRIAKADGSPLKITSAEQDCWSHTFLRSRVDAILVGVETVVRDNPQLNTRLAQILPQNEGIKNYQPWRIILDAHLRIPLRSFILRPEEATRTIIIASDVPEEGKEERRREIQKKGARVFTVPLAADVFDFGELWKVLASSDGDFHGITSILVEGGARTWQAFREAGFVDEEAVLVGKVY